MLEGQKSVMYGERIRGIRLELRYLLPSDVNEGYLRWFDDSETVRFLEARHIKHTIDSLQDFVIACSIESREHLFGIFELSSDRHIGNIKIGPINVNHRSASVGLLIGEKDCRDRLCYRSY